MRTLLMLALLAGCSSNTTIHRVAPQGDAGASPSALGAPGGATAGSGSAGAPSGATGGFGTSAGGTGPLGGESSLAGNSARAGAPNRDGVEVPMGGACVPGLDWCEDPGLCSVDLGFCIWPEQES